MSRVDESADLGLDDDGRVRFEAALELIGRAAASKLEIGWSDDDGPHPGEFYASAHYRGARVTVEHQQDPVEATEALALKLIAGGECVHCGRLVTAGRSDGQVYAIAGHPRLDPEVLNTCTLHLCIWRRDGEHWLRGCDGSHGEPADGLNRAQRRRQDKARRLRR